MACGMTPERVMAEVDAVMSRPLEWGISDCSTAACDVFARLWGFDPMAPVRGYRGRLAAHVLMRDAGGLAALACDLAARAGLMDGHAVGGLAIAETGKSLLVCVSPGLWAGKTASGFGLMRAAGQGWHCA